MRLSAAAAAAFLVLRGKGGSGSAAGREIEDLPIAPPLVEGGKKREIV